jgi:hypothetical protein
MSMTTLPSEPSAPIDPLTGFISGHSSAYCRGDSFFDLDVDNTEPFSLATSGLFDLFNDALIGNVIDHESAKNIASFLASHHQSRSTTPLDVSAGLLETNGVQGIDGTVMYPVLEWSEQTPQGHERVTAVFKASPHSISLVIRSGAHLFQGYPQTRYQWFCWDSDDIKDILFAGGEELGLLPTFESPHPGRLVLFYTL